MEQFVLLPELPAPEICDIKGCVRVQSTDEVQRVVTTDAASFSVCCCIYDLERCSMV
jgi:hypothetical protein